jgi:SWI/SNF-related matrix-associated actin-dependent regulator 1 of chromatin subfamily A
LKNPKSQRYERLIKIPAQFRLLLTGTPLQNNLLELAALLGFILPEVFRDRQEELDFIFKHKASTRDSDHAALLSSQRITRAKSMLTPFVLRRKKDQVLKHMPAKTCRVEYCDLHPSQAIIYDGLREKARERARLRVQGAKIPNDRENNPLMQLRKAAIHPMMFRRHFTDQKVHKMLELLKKNMPTEFPEKNHKHLLEEMVAHTDWYLHIWCQLYPCISKFDVPDLVLDILEAILETSRIQFTRIDGSTKVNERQTLIDDFRDDETTTVFLLSTGAGGTGLNLMMANKVVIFDSSFNPQDDIQAENRAHRVGQTRDVEVVRLITKGTIEEQIYALGQTKLALDSKVAGHEEIESKGEELVAKLLLEEESKVKPSEDANDTEPEGTVENAVEAENKEDDNASSGKRTSLARRSKQGRVE